MLLCIAKAHALETVCFINEIKKKSILSLSAEVPGGVQAPVELLSDTHYTSGHFLVVFPPELPGE